MRIRFLRDFRSKYTGEIFYEKGALADLPEGAAVVAEGAAESVPLVAREGQATPAAPVNPPKPAPKGRRA